MSEDDPTEKGVPSCPNCLDMVSLTWNWCPYCGEELDWGERIGGGPYAVYPNNGSGDASLPREGEQDG